jgi:hypothetical protein
MEKQYMTLVVEYTATDDKPVYPSAFLSDTAGAKMIGYAVGNLIEESDNIMGSLARLEGAVETLDIWDAINEVIEDE